MVFGFGKRASNSSASSDGGGDDTYRQQPPHIRRLIDAMQTIFDDTSKLAEAITQGGSLPSSTPEEPHLSPIRCAQSEKLFEHPNENGETLYTTFHFTKDFKTITAAAQHFLYVMYGKIYFANLLADKLSNGQASDGEIAALRNAIDEILAISAYYISLFRCYTLTIAYVSKSMSDEDLKKAMDAYGTDWVRKLDAAKRAMFRPERLIELVPDRHPQLLLAASEPYREGQRVINGVYFKPEHAEAMLKIIAAAQAEALNARPPLKDLRDKQP
jgi:hypothetical protein